MRGLAFVLLALAATNASAQAQAVFKRMGETTTYSCLKDGLRVYSSKPIEGGEQCKESKVSYPIFAIYGPGPGWVPVGQSDTGMGSLYYRMTDVARSGRTASIWVMSAYSANMSLPGLGSFLSSVERWTVDCSEKSMGTQQTTYYAGPYGTGQVVGTRRPLGGPSTRFAVPNSIDESIVNAACKPAKKSAAK